MYKHFLNVFSESTSDEKAHKGGFSHVKNDNLHVNSVEIDRGRKSLEKKKKIAKRNEKKF